MMPNIDLEPKQVKILLGLLKNCLPNTTAWAYGSRVKWTSRPSSDLDMVVFTLPEQKSQVFALQEALERSDLPFRVDLFVWDEVPEEFKESIKKQHVVLTAPVSGNIPDGWVSKKIGEIMPFTYGKSLAGRDRASSGAVPVYGSNGVVGLHDKAITHGPTVIIGRKGTAGAVHFSPGPCWPIDTTFYIEGKDRELVRFQYYALQSLGLEGMNTDSAVPGLNRTAAHTRQIIVPVSARERQSIAGVLGALDDKIELNRRTNGTLEAMARALFKSWFVDFDPVHAKAALRSKVNHSPQGGSDWSAGGWTVAQARAYLDQMSPEVMALFPDRLDDEGKPVGWETSEVGKEVATFGGGTPSTAEPAYWSEGRHHWVTPKDLSKLPSPVLLGTERRITDAGVDRISSGILPVGTLLLSSRAPVGYLAIAEIPTAINQGFIGMVCEKRLSNLFMLGWCQENLDVLKGMATGSTFAELNKRAFRPLPIIVPAEPVLKAYEEAVRPLYSQVVANMKEANSLAKTRDLLLPELISGRVRVLGA